jgi:hypothetical protein
MSCLFTPFDFIQGYGRAASPLPGSLAWYNEN